MVQIEVFELKKTLFTPFHEKNAVEISTELHWFPKNSYLAFAFIRSFTRKILYIMWLMCYVINCYLDFLELITRLPQHIYFIE